MRPNSGETVNSALKVVGEPQTKVAGGESGR